MRAVFGHQVWGAEPAPARADRAYQAISLEQVAAAVGQAGAERIAERLTERYRDFTPVHTVLAASFGG